VERNGDSGGGYESHLQAFIGGDTRGNIVQHTGCGGYVETGMV